MNYAIYTKEGKRNRKAGEYEDAVITLCGPPEVESNMVNRQNRMQNVFTCTKFVRSLACYIGTGYVNQ